MLKIRLMRIGTKKRPFYRVVAVDEQAKRTGGYIELLGTYNPLSQPKEIILKQDRIDHWVKQGAQMSNGFLRIIGKAKPRLPRKAKKEKKEQAPEAKAETKEEVKNEDSEKPVETAAEAPQEEVKTEEPKVEEKVEEPAKAEGEKTDEGSS